MTTILAVLGSTGLFTLIQFLIKRHDEKKGMMSFIKEEITSLKNAVVDIEERRKRDNADDARRRILAASDELRSNTTLHSEEWFNQLNGDIDEYERYCDKHPEYRNNKAVQSIEHIKRIYQKRLEKNDFL